MSKLNCQMYRTQLLHDLENFLASEKVTLTDFLRALQEAGPLEHGFTILREVLAKSHGLQEKLLEVVLSDHKDEDRLLAVRLLDSLARFPEQEKREKLLDALALERNEDIRRELIVFIGTEEKDNPRVVKMFLAMMEKVDNEATRINLLEELASSNTAEASGYFRSTLEDPKSSDSLKATMLDALYASGRLKPDSPDYAWLRPLLLSAVRIGPDDNLSVDRRGLLVAAAEALSRTQDRDALPVLIDALKLAKQSEVRALVAHGLGGFPCDDTRAALLNVAAQVSETAAVRKAAIRSLGRMLTPEVVGVLQRIADDPSTPSDIAQAARSLVNK